jgi:protocatechuate 3,4-dioxygenase beta subunit
MKPKPLSILIVIIVSILSIARPQAVYAAGGTISGFVRTENGQGIGGVMVLSDTGAPNYGGMRSTKTNSDGSYTLSGVYTGSNHLRASITGRAYSHYWNFSVEDGKSYTNINFTLRPGGGSVSGRVTDANGAGVANASINVFEKTDQGFNNGAYATTTTDSNGYYSTNPTADGGLPTGNFLVTASQGVTARRDNVSVTAGHDTPNVNLSFISGSGSITGRIFDSATNGAVSGASVLADNGLLQSAATTDSNGVYVINGLTTGGYNVVVTKPGFANSHSYGIQVTDGNRTTGVDFGLTTQMGQISGKVTNQSGQPLAGVGILVDSTVGKGFGNASTDANGNYLVSNLAPMAYVVHADYPGYARVFVETSVENGKTTTNVNIVMGTAGGAISGRITKDGQAAAFAGIYVNSSGGTGQSFYGNGIADANGSYTIGNLPAGKYDVHVSDVPGYANQARFNISVGKGTTSGVDFNLTNGSAKITGHVKGPDGKPLVGAKIQAFLTQNPGTWAEVTTDSSGNYSIGNMWGGQYNIYANFPAYDTIVKNMVPVPDQTTTQVDFVMGVPRSLVITPDKISILLNKYSFASSLEVGVSYGSLTDWTASTDAAWLYLGLNGTNHLASGQPGETVYLHLDPNKVSSNGTYQALVTISAPDVAPALVEVTMVKSSVVKHVYLPITAQR